jgi:hypothetical protein
LGIDNLATLSRDDSTVIARGGLKMNNFPILVAPARLYWNTGVNWFGDLSLMRRARFYRLDRKQQRELYRLEQAEKRQIDIAASIASEKLSQEHRDDLERFKKRNAELNLDKMSNAERTRVTTFDEQLEELRKTHDRIYASIMPEKSNSTKEIIERASKQRRALAQLRTNYYVDEAWRYGVPLPDGDEQRPEVLSVAELHTLRSNIRKERRDRW